MKKLTKEELLKIIQALISNNKLGVIQALINSNVEADINMSKNDIFNIIMNEFRDGNGYLIFHISKLMEKQYKNETFSNGKGGAAAGGIVSGVGSMLGGLIGGWFTSKANKEIAKTQYAAAQSNNATALALAQIKKDTALALVDRQPQSKSNTTLYVVGGLVTAVAITGLVLVLLRRRRNG